MFILEMKTTVLAATLLFLVTYITGTGVSVLPPRTTMDWAILLGKVGIIMLEIIKAKKK